MGGRHPHCPGCGERRQLQPQGRRRRELPCELRRALLGRLVEAGRPHWGPHLLRHARRRELGARRAQRTRRSAASRQLILSAAPPSVEASDSGSTAIDRDWVGRRRPPDRSQLRPLRRQASHPGRLAAPRRGRRRPLSQGRVDPPSGSLKHRLARSLFLYGLSNGWIKRGKTVVECSSGSTAISEAYFARLLRLRFIAVAPRTTAKPKIEAIEIFGGEGRLVEPAQIYDEGRRKSMRLLAISGSLRRASINTAALEALARLAPEGVKVLLYRDLEKLWPFNPDDDIEEKAKPEPVETLCALVDASDALVIAAPEYAPG